MKAIKNAWNNFTNQSLCLFAVVSYKAFRERLGGWRYPLTVRNHDLLRYRVSRDRVEQMILHKLRYSNSFKKFLERTNKDFALVCSVTEDALWINFHRAHKVEDEEISPAFEAAYNEWRGLDGTFNYLASGQEIRRAALKYGIFYLPAEPVMTLKIRWHRNEREYLVETAEHEAPYFRANEHHYV